MKNKIMVLLAVLMLMAAAVSATIVTVTENPEFPTSTQNVEICAAVTDVPSLVTSVVLDWDNGIDSGSLAMTDPDGDNTFCRTLSWTTMSAVNDMTVDYDVTSMNASGVDDTASGDYTYDDEAPVADAAGDYACDEGEAIFLDGSNSFDNLGIASYLWSAPNGGVFTDPTEMNPEFTCYGGNGVYTLNLRVTDFGGRTDTDAALVTVTNVAPTADAGGPYVCSEGQLLPGGLDGSGSSDPGLDLLVYEWDLNTNVDSNGDGIANNDVDATGENPAYNCGDGLQILPIALTVSDEEDSDTDSSQITIINGAPRVTSLQVVGGVVNEGTPMTLRVIFTDYGPDTHDALINWGDGSMDTVVDPANSPFQTVHTYADGDNDFTSYTITVTITDDDAASGSRTLNVNVFNVAPTADVGGPYNAELGLEFDDFVFSATDPAGVNDDLTYYWNYDYTGNFDCDGDFDVDADDFVCADDYEGTSPSETYGTLGDYTVALMVCDEDYTTFGLDSGCSVIDTTTVTVWDWVTNLHTGWNLISIPLVPLDENGNIDTSIQNVFLDPLGSAIADDVTFPVMSYQFSDLMDENVWYLSTITGTGNGSTLAEVVPGYAYWIKIDQATVLTGNGQELNGWGMPPEVSLQTLTWNLIGKYGNTEALKIDQVDNLGYNDPDMRDLADYAVVGIVDENCQDVPDGSPCNGDYLGLFDPMIPKEGYWTFTGGNTFFTDQPVRYIPSECDLDSMACGGP